MNSVSMNYCSKCGLAVIHGIKACTCDAPIIAEMESVVKGRGGVSKNGRVQWQDSIE